MATRIRPPAVAGTFYPANPSVLRSDVQSLLRDDAEQTARADTTVSAPATPAAWATRGVCPKAVIAPHAGYVYSGPTAAVAYAPLAPFADSIKHVVILGPAHYVGARAVVLPDVDALETPLGLVPIWQDAVQTALSTNNVIFNDEVHRREHSIEVQLPFLQCVLGDFDVLPLAVSWVSPRRTAEAVRAVWSEPGTVVVVSSDLSHYHSYAEAVRLDAATIAQILDLKPTIDHDQACGATGINALLVLAHEYDLSPMLLGACNSGDTAGDKHRVVGYSAFRFD